MEQRTRLDDRRASRQLLQKSIEQGLLQAVGESGVEMISRLRPTDLLAADPRKLHELLVSIFAEEGALIIERKIARTLLDNLGSAAPAKVSWPQHLLDLFDSGRGKPDGGPEYETRVIRRFAETADLPGVHSSHRLGAATRKRARASMDSTAASFANGFKKGK